MVKDFFKWYEQRIDETAVDPIYIWKHGMKEADQYRRNGGTIDMGDNGTKYIFKMSHSRYYKNHRKEFASHGKIPAHIQKYALPEPQGRHNRIVSPHTPLSCPEFPVL